MPCHCVEEEEEEEEEEGRNSISASSSFVPPSKKSRWQVDGCAPEIKDGGGKEEIDTVRPGGASCACGGRREGGRKRKKTRQCLPHILPPIPPSPPLYRRSGGGRAQRERIAPTKFLPSSPPCCQSFFGRRRKEEGRKGVFPHSPLSPRPPAASLLPLSILQQSAQEFNLRNGPSLPPHLTRPVNISWAGSPSPHTTQESAHPGWPAPMHRSRRTEVAYLDGLDKGEEQDPDADAPPQQLDEPGGAEEPEDAHRHDLGGVDDAPHHRDEVERVPRVLEVGLQKMK